jgi:hypothetical protein
LRNSEDDILLQKIRIRERLKQNYSLRMVKYPKIIRIFADNKPIFEITENLGRRGRACSQARPITSHYFISAISN